MVRDLIANFEAIWEPTDAEKRREAAVRRVLMTVLGNVAPAPKKAAGDLRAWVYVRDRSTCHQVTVRLHTNTAIVFSRLFLDKTKAEDRVIRYKKTNRLN